MAATASSAATTSTTARPPRCTPRARSCRTSCSSSPCTRRATISPSTPTTRPTASSTRNEDNGFWGAKIDWQINDQPPARAARRSPTRTKRCATASASRSRRATRGSFGNTRFTNNGGLNWSATYTGYLADTLSMKVLYGENEREFSRFSNNDVECSRVRDLRPGGGGDVGCTASAERGGTHRHARGGARRFRVGAGRSPGALRHGPRDQHLGARPVLSRAGAAAVRDPSHDCPDARERRGGAGRHRVRAHTPQRGRRRVRDDQLCVLPRGQLVDHATAWCSTAGVRWEAFDNKNSDGDSYIKMDDMVAPRFGFSWDMKGDNRSKLFGNAGRYFLPVANVINIKQAGGFLDERTLLPVPRLRAVRLQRHHAAAADPRRAARQASTTRRATAPSATCAAKSTRTWIRSTRTS